MIIERHVGVELRKSMDQFVDKHNAGHVATQSVVKNIESSKLRAQKTCMFSVYIVHLQKTYIIVPKLST